MMEFDPLYIPLGFLAVVVPIVVTVAVKRAVNVRRRERRRVVELPNSHYTSPLVRERDTRSRWHDIPLDTLHEINRAEVTRLLSRIDAAGADILKPAERTFLDRMANASGTPLQ